MPLDLDGLTTLMLTREPKLLRCAQRLVGDVETAEDLVQETFRRCLERCIAGQQSSEGAWAAYFFTTIRNLSITERRRRDRRPATGLEDSLGAAPVTSGGDVSPELAAIRQEEADRLRALVAALPALQRQAITLVDLRGVRIARAARELLRSSSSIKVARYRGHRRLAEVWGRSRESGCPPGGPERL